MIPHQPGPRSREQLADDVKRLIGGHLGVLAMELNEAQRVQEDLGADAFDQVELVMTANERFNVSIDLRQATAIHTIGDLVEAVWENLLHRQHPRANPHPAKSRRRKTTEVTGGQK